MKQWYVLLEDLTYEQISEIVMLMRVAGADLLSTGKEDCLGCWFNEGEEYSPYLDLDYWPSAALSPQDQITFEEAKELLS